MVQCALFLWFFLRGYLVFPNMYDFMYSAYRFFICLPVCPMYFLLHFILYTRDFSYSSISSWWLWILLLSLLVVLNAILRLHFLNKFIILCSFADVCESSPFFFCYLCLLLSYSCCFFIFFCVVSVLFFKLCQYFFFVFCRGINVLLNNKKTKI